MCDLHYSFKVDVNYVKSRRNVAVATIYYVMEMYMEVFTGMTMQMQIYPIF